MYHHVLFVLTGHGELGHTGRKTGWHCSEVSHPYKILRDAGCEISFASPDGGPVPMDPNSEDNSDPINAEFCQNPMDQAALSNTLASQEIQAGQYDAIYFVGGHGTMWDLPDNPHLQEAARYIYERGGVVAAICHGPAGLLNVRLSNGKLLVEGKEMTSFSDDEERSLNLDQVVPFLLESELRKRGARYSCAPRGQSRVVVSERLVTGQNPASADELAHTLLKLMTQLKTARKEKATAEA